MDKITTLLPLVIEAFKQVPSAIRGAKDLYNGAVSIWNGLTADEQPTPEQRTEYRTARQVAFKALMDSTADQGEEGDLER